MATIYTLEENLDQERQNAARAQRRATFWKRFAFFGWLVALFGWAALLRFLQLLSDAAR